jgi:hypothetical protein
MQASSTGVSSVWADAPELTYTVNLATTGTYHVWVRGYATDSGSDSLRWGFDGVEISGTGGVFLSQGSWVWKELGTVTVSTAGQHILNIRRREGRNKLDRFYLTTSSTNPTTLNSGQGPAESDDYMKPLVTDMTAEQTVNKNSSATIAVTASGTDLQYQWYRVSGYNTRVAEAGATGASYTVSVTAERYFQCDVSNPAGTVTSPNAHVIVTTAPTITTQPTDPGTVTFGSAVTLTVVATGSSPSYTWKRGTTTVASDSSAMTIPYATKADEGSYTCKVSNAAGNVTTTAITLTVDTTGAPTGQGFTESSGSVTMEAEHFTTSASGTGFAAYAEGSASPAGFVGSYLQASSESSQSVWADAPALSYTVNLATTGTYRVWVRGYATDSGSDSFRWGFDGVEISGTGGVFLAQGSWTWKEIGTVAVSTAGQHVLNIRRREKLNKLDRFYLTTSSTNPSTLNSGQGPTENASYEATPIITAHPQAVTAAIGGSATFSVSVQNSTSYQWFHDGILISGATGSSYTDSNVQQSDGGFYKVVAYNAIGSVTSAEVLLYPQGLFQGLTIKTVTAGAGALFAVTPKYLKENGDDIITVTYQWQKKISGVWTNLSGSTGASLLIASATTGDAGEYRVQLTCSGFSWYVPSATLTVN